MTCSRCGADAAIKREAAFYCGKCAMARDWEEVIAVVQADSAPASGILDFNAAPIEAVPHTHPDPEPERPAQPEQPAQPQAAAQSPEIELAMDPAPQPAPEPETERVAVASNGSAAVSNELPADPFG